MDPEIRAKLDQHLISARSKIYRTISGGMFELMRDWTRAYSGVPVSTYNIFQPLTPEGLTDDTLADTAAFFSSMGVLYAVELVHDQFPEGPDYLDKLHYQPLPPHLAMYFDGPSNFDGIELNSGATVEHVTNVPSLTAFCTLLHQTFDYNLDDMIKLHPVLHLSEDLRDTIRYYLAFVDEQPVGAGTLICLDGVASISNVCTADAYRRQGVATTLVHQMLTDADEMGYQLKVLYSTAHSFSLFSRYNFEIFTQRQWFLPSGVDYEEW